MSMEIGVKIVGPIPASASSSTTDKNNDDPQPRNFTITVEPEDAISTLHKQIEAITGLETPQQRLIYRGRVIGATSNGTSAAAAAAAGNQNHSIDEDDPKELRICDVAGLSDGHMIHLVPRPATETSDSTDSASGTATTTATATTGTTRSGQSDNPDLDSSEPTVIRGSGGAGLLAALLGMGLSSGGSRGNDDGEESGSLDIESLLSSLPMGSPTPRPAARSLRRRPNSHRRTAADQLYPTPCPLEPVRQGIMTLHTMIGGQSADDTSDIHSHSAPFHAKRMFYRGQWLDVRDTVNQWLEATVVEVLTPDEILQRAPRNVSDEHGMNSSSASASYMQGKRPATDPAIGSNDHEGRLRLLLEEGEDESDRTLADLNHDDDLIGWKERDNNDNLQMLLVHYNGWPHRWDEWIRSDSERIRPFRTRSKHQPTRDHVSPSPDSTFHSAPSTFIKSEEDKVDAHAILPELHRALASVQNLFAGAIHEEDPSSLIRTVGTDSNEKTLSRMEQSNLSNAMKSLSPGQVEEVMRIVQGTHEGGKNMDPADIDILELDNKTQLKLKNMLRPSEPDDSPQNQQNQLPWKSKCSNTSSRNDYDDDGPHMSRHQREDHVDFDKKKLQALAPLLDRLGRIMVDIAPHVASVADSLPQEVVETSEDADDAEISIMDSISRQLRPSWSSERDETESRTGHDVESHSDYVDFVNGFVNFRNNNTSANRRSRSNNSDSSIGSSLLSAYLSSAMNERTSENGDEGNGDNGPRVVRIGGGGGGTGGGGRPGGGVDIHIHAVVTGPGGMPMQGLPDLEGMSNLLNTNPTANNSDNGTNNRTTVNTHQPGIPTVSENTVAEAEPDDDDGLFDDLYSEYPNQDRNPHASWRNMEDEIIDDASESEVGLLQEMAMNNNGSSSSSLMRQQNVENSSSSNVLDAELEDRSDGDSEDDKISPPLKTEDDSDSSDNDSELSNQPPNAIANERDIACIPPNDEQHDAKEELELNRIKEDVEPEQQQQDSNETHIDDVVNRGEHILDGAHSENLREDTARRVPIFSRIFRRAINRRPSSSHGRD